MQDHTCNHTPPIPQTHVAMYNAIPHGISCDTPLDIPWGTHGTSPMRDIIMGTVPEFGTALVGHNVLTASVAVRATDDMRKLCPMSGVQHSGLCPYYLVKGLEITAWGIPHGGSPLGDRHGKLSVGSSRGGSPQGIPQGIAHGGIPMGKPHARSSLRILLGNPPWPMGVLPWGSPWGILHGGSTWGIPMGGPPLGILPRGKPPNGGSPMGDPQGHSWGTPWDTQCDAAWGILGYPIGHPMAMASGHGQ